MSCQVAPAPLCHICCSSSPTPAVPSEQAEPQSSIWEGCGIGEMVQKGWPAVLPWPAAAPEGPELNCSCGKPQPALKFILDSWGQLLGKSELQLQAGERGGHTTSFSEESILGSGFPRLGFPNPFRCHPLQLDNLRAEFQFNPLSSFALLYKFILLTKVSSFPTIHRPILNPLPHLDQPRNLNKNLSPDQ